MRAGTGTRLDASRVIRVCAAIGTDAAACAVHVL